MKTLTYLFLILAISPCLTQAYELQDKELDVDIVTRSGQRPLFQLITATRVTRDCFSFKFSTELKEQTLQFREDFCFRFYGESEVVESTILRPENRNYTITFNKRLNLIEFGVMHISKELLQRLKKKRRPRIPPRFHYTATPKKGDSNLALTKEELEEKYGMDDDKLLWEFF